MLKPSTYLLAKNIYRCGDDQTVVPIYYLIVLNGLTTRCNENKLRNEHVSTGRVNIIYSTGHKISSVICE